MTAPFSLSCLSAPKLLGLLWTVDRHIHRRFFRRVVPYVREAQREDVRRGCFIVMGVDSRVTTVVTYQMV